MSLARRKALLGELKPRSYSKHLPRYRSASLLDDGVGSMGDVIHWVDVKTLYLGGISRP